MTSSIEGDWVQVGIEPVEKHHSPATDLLLGHSESAPPRSLTRALRFSTNNDFFQKPSRPLDSWSASIPRNRTFSMASNARSSSKGKERDVFDPLESGSFASSFALDDDMGSPFTSKPTRRASLPRPATADSASSPTFGCPRKNRGSILGAASDALRFGRRRKSIKALPPLPPQPRLLLPEVIEVRASAPTPTFDEEEEAEREQLRAAAVQSVGFDVNISRPPDREHTAFGDNNEREEDEADANEHEHRHTSPSVLAGGLPPAVDNGKSDVPGSTQFVGARGRMSSPAAISGALPPLALSPTTPQAEMLAFPSTRSQITAYEQLSATLPKHYPPPTLLMLALTKQWKPRHVVLTAPELTGASYLHIFKSSASDERELERLEINERSVVFLNDEDVGGRRGVVRVGGVDVGALRRDLNGEENGLTMMTLQIVDANESQNWINAIKNAVLGQRYVNAGLGIPSNPSGAPEPRGDLDVMLSMRMQGILPSPVKPSFSSADDTNKPQQNGSSEDVPATSQPPSVRSRPASPRPQTGVLSLKSLFSVSGSGSTRPRSPSSPRTTSPDVPSGDSFGSAASSLLSMRPVADSPLIKPYSMLPPTGPQLDLASQLQRKIIDTQANLDLAPLENPSKSSHSILPSSRPMSPSLNPPPCRKRSNTTTNEPFQAPSSSPDPGRLVYNHGNASTAGSFGVPVPETARPPLERTWSERGKPRAGSVSTTSTETESGSAKRWSRPSSMLPPRPIPSDDLSTPVAVVPPQPATWQNGAWPSHDSDRAPSRSSSQSQKTLPSVISGLQVASKRTSTSSSVYSVATTNSNLQHVGMFSIARSVGNGHRLSVPPPPRPAPSTALPPTPTGSDSDSSATPPMPPPKPARRNSLARRALRLSLGQPAPSMQVQAQLSPRVTEGFNTTSTSRSHNRSTSVDSVPRPALSHGHSHGHGHVIPSALLVPPSPPPTGPLPPPPLVVPTPTSAPAPLPSVPRTSSFKQRLRILSAPSGRSTPPPPAIATVVPPPALPALEIPTAISPTPIYERIAHIAPDADFLHLEGDTPVATAPPPRARTAPLFEDETGDGDRDGDGDGRVMLSHFTFPLPPPLPSRSSYRHPLPPLPDRSPQQMTVLSPPPRKGSIRPLPAPSPEQERGPSAAWDDEDMLPLTPPPLDLARNTSTLSLSIVSGAV